MNNRFFFSLVGLNSGLCACKTGTLSFEPVHFVLVILEMWFSKLFARAGLEP
jgi:hypothetical protein